MNGSEIPHFRLGDSPLGGSYWADYRLVKSGVAPIHKYPSGARLDHNWVLDKVENGFTDDELAKLAAYNEHKRVAS